MRPEDERYFAEIESELDDAFEVANEARRRGDDPEPEVEIPVARDMADRVENILGIDGVAERVRELEGEMSREEAALELVEDFVAGAVGDYETRAGKIEGAVRTAVALLTEGVVAAPIEGIDRVELLQNDDGTEFINVYYAGPIRSAGGTAQALSVLVADYARALLDIDEYHARSEEIGRYAQEVALYDDETGLQYAPGETEAEFIAEHMPIMLDGEATGDEEVSGYRDLDRVDTNAARGGMCLVLGEGIALKAPKIQRYTRELDEVAWPWLQDLIDGTYKEKESHEDQPPENDGDSTGDESNGGDTGDESSGGDTGESNDDEETSDDGRVEDSPPRPDSSKKYLQDLIAGRPVFSHPSETGGFRLRYGRSRNHGHATAGVHPATMRLVDDFLAAGTQIKTERPGKAAGVVPVDTIEGPTVRLANGDVRRIDDESEALALRNGVERVLDLGEYLVNYGEFVENNHPLAPASYVFEWWIQEFEAAGAPVQAMRDSASIDLADPAPAEALEWARTYDAPLHPAYTYLWHDVSVEQVVALARAIDEAEVVAADGQSRQPPGARDGHSEAHTGSDRDRRGDDRLVLRRTEPVREALEALLVEHTQDDDWLSVPCWRPLVRTLGFDDSLERSWCVDGVSEAARGYADGENAIRVVNEIAPFAVRERAPTRIGNRMGRPEKSEQRELSPAVHTLFPIGDAGGNQRSIVAATEYGDELDGTRGDVSVEVGRRDCVDCGTRTYRPRCPSCGGVAEAVYVCPDCDREVAVDESGRAECDRCGAMASPTREVTIDVGDELERALDAVGERTAAFDALKGVKGLSSAEKTPEPLEKGVLRAKHDVSAFKDGTIRYDMTDLPVTAVRPSELDVTAERFRELGYGTDVRGDPLRHDDQLVELRVQDVVLSEGAAEHLLRTAEFVDDLLSQYYGLDPYYEFDERDDLVGELVFGMAPHTSAATVGRVVGFTTAAVGYAHPYFHAAKRRNCFHPETAIWYEDEAGACHYERIGDVVDSYLDTAAADTDDVGTIVDPLDHLDGTLHVPALDDDGTQSRRPIDALSKHPAPDHLVRIETESGRELEVTPDHEVHVHDPDRDRIVSVAAGHLDEGAALVAPAHLESIDPSIENHATITASGGPLRASFESALDAGDGARTEHVPAYASDGGSADYHLDPVGSADYHLDPVEQVSYTEATVDHVYCLTVTETHSLVAENLSVGQCDGDEDCVMLLLDGMLNFSKQYLPDKRGGKMDAPLVMSSRIDPTEIDDEAHNVDIMTEYPREFYEATRELADPEAVEDVMRIAEETLGTDREYTEFRHTHDTADIAAGPDLSAYKTLGSMEEKMDAQLALSRRIRAVDETDVAERIIEYHFLPDLLGNLKAFARQDVRCLGCGEKYRRAPLSGECRHCGGDVTLTVHEGSVNKYMDTAIRIAEEFDTRDYTKQRLEILERRIDRLFEDDTNKSSTLAEFM